VINQISPDGKWQWDGAAWQPHVVAAQPPHKKKGHLFRNLAIVFGALFVFGIAVAVASNPSQVKQGAAGSFTAPTAQATTQPTAQATTQPTAQATAAPIAPAGPTLTNQQQQAVGSAQDYLNFMAFSRQGLIDQLSSAYGEGYSVKDATIAVDSLKVDWNAEAAQSAKDYLKTMHFSCKGLIQQLDSAYGEKFTVAQATYGAHQAGAC